MSKTRWFVVSGLALLAGCVSQPPVPLMVTSAPTQMYSEVLAAAGTDEHEFTVRPLRDPQVEDLRTSAKAALAAQDAATAAGLLDTALQLVPDDPALLQERAELALLLSQFEHAEKLSLRAVELGSATGPLCRRHWETARQVRRWQRELSATDTAQRFTPGEPENEALRQRDACTVPSINRM